MPRPRLLWWPKTGRPAPVALGPSHTSLLFPAWGPLAEVRKGVLGQGCGRTEADPWAVPPRQVPCPAGAQHKCVEGSAC